MTPEEIERLRSALNTINRLRNFGDGVYDVRDREGCGWNGEDVMAYSRAVAVVEEFIWNGKKE